MCALRIGRTVNFSGDTVGAHGEMDFGQAYAWDHKKPLAFQHANSIQTMGAQLEWQAVSQKKYQPVPSSHQKCTHAFSALIRRSRE